MRWESGTISSSFSIDHLSYPWFSFVFLSFLDLFDFFDLPGWLDPFPLPVISSRRGFRTVRFFGNFVSSLGLPPLPLDTGLISGIDLSSALLLLPQLPGRCRPASALGGARVT